MLKKYVSKSLGIFILLLLALEGCSTTPYRKTSDPTQIPSLSPAALLKFADIPTPSAFKFVPESSYVFQSSNFRAGLLKYSGKASGDQAVVFFKEQMPMYNWRIVNIVEYGRRLISLEKEQETCIISIDEKGGTTDIIISIAPKSQIAPSRKTDKPLK